MVDLSLKFDRGGINKKCGRYLKPTGYFKKSGIVDRIVNYGKSITFKINNLDKSTVF